MELDFSALRSGPLTLHLITQAKAPAIRSILAAQPDIDAVLAEFDSCYIPRFDPAGRQRSWGFYATLHDQPAGLSMVGVNSWENARGYTGADAIPHMRGRGVTPGSKPHLFYFAFVMLGLNRVETGCFVSNTASHRSLLKTPGLRYEGLLRQYGRNERGEFEDEYRFAILRSDWLETYDPAAIEVLP